MKQTVTFQGKQTTFNIANQSDHIEKHIIQTGSFYEMDMLQDILNRVAEKACIVDAGGYVGNHTLFFAQHCLAKKVYVFEPSPASYRTLKSNIEANKLRNVEAFQMGLGARRGQAKLISSKDSNAGMNKLDTKQSSGAVKVDSLDNLLFKKEKKVHLIKIDVEGMEAEVIKGAEKIIKRDSPLIYVEIIDEKEFQKLKNYLKRYSYKNSGVFNATPTYLFMATNHSNSKISKIKKVIYNLISP